MKQTAVVVPSPVVEQTVAVIPFPVVEQTAEVEPNAVKAVVEEGYYKADIAV